MLGIDGHKVIVSGKFADAVRKAAKASLSPQEPTSKKDSQQQKISFNWK